MFLNDRLIYSFNSEERFTKGAAMIAAGNAVVHFDNIVIKGNGISSLAVSPQAKLATRWGEIKQNK